ncbi:MAG TPA: RsmB/NOP family class I SAM-dependent RNA methyltransferase [Candidatus Didemnitutus sp.]
MSTPPSSHLADGWAAAISLTERWLRHRERIDSLLEQLAPALPPQERARAQHLFFGVVRWESRIATALDGLLARPPRPRLRALIEVMGFELIEADPESAAPVVHHAVERAKILTSPGESRLVNAVGRKLAVQLKQPPNALAAEFAHPDWLVERWESRFGADATRRLLAWNQMPGVVHVRWRGALSGIPAFLRPSRWPGFYTAEPGRWDEVRALVDQGSAYIQDPSTRNCIDLLDPKPGEDILDACAAPGGKSLMIADRLAAGSGGTVVAVDEPGPRIDRLKSNLAKAPAGVTVALMPVDLGRLDGGTLRDANLPEQFDAVLLDAPCSNTGVMRHRVDVKWRLQAGDFARHSDQQLALLRTASKRVRPGGRLVYSTCSIDAAENEDVVRRFLEGARDWKLARQDIALPWIAGHDGAAAFLLSHEAPNRK